VSYERQEEAQRERDKLAASLAVMKIWRDRWKRQASNLNDALDDSEARCAALASEIAAVRADERERCAQVADAHETEWRALDDKGKVVACKLIGAALRARGTP
jgi:hypothetical protein